MKPFDTVRTRVIPLDINNCDTDQIIPARFLSRARSSGFSGQLFHDLRYENGRELPDFPMNRPEAIGAQILVAGPNFGCGSSRESAVWALVDWGVRAILAPSFGDIFFGNAFKNGLLLIQLTTSETEGILSLAQSQPERLMEIELSNQLIRYGDTQFKFNIDAMRKQMLLSGMDEITFTLTHFNAIVAFGNEYDRRYSWLSDSEERQPHDPV